jgi:hypothetical protein
MQRSGWILFFAIVLFCLPLAMAQSVDPFEGVDSHDVPHCSPKGGPKSAQCKCLGMVSDVRREQTAGCWEAAGMKDLKDIPEELRLLAPPAVTECLGRVMDHCEVIARTPYQLGYEGKNTCRTACKPESCRCSDSACRAHGDPGANY